MRTILVFTFIMVVCYLLTMPDSTTSARPPGFNPIEECKKLGGKVVLQEYANYPQNRFGFRACIVDADKLMNYK